MEALEADKVLLFLFCVVPGFVALKAYETMSGWRSGDTSRQLMDALTYSFANYVVCAFPVWWMHQHGVPQEHPFWYGAFWLFTVLILPVSLSLGFWKLRTSRFMQSSFPHPVGRAWDYVFSRRTRHWVIVTLKDGKQFAGKYDSRSFSSSAPHPEQLYLEQAWKLTASGGFDRARRDTAGILLLGSEIVSVELFNITEGVANDRQEINSRGIPAVGEKGISTSASIEPAAGRISAGDQPEQAGKPAAEGTLVDSAGARHAHE